MGMDVGRGRRVTGKRWPRGGAIVRLQMWGDCKGDNADNLTTLY